MAEVVTWAGLLAQGVELAQASRALPASEEGDRWRASVAPLIECQALRIALASLGRLPREDRPLARDLAATTLRGAATTLDEVWRGHPMPEAILEIAEDAKRALDQSAYAGLRMMRLRADRPPIFLPAMPGIEAFAAAAVERRGTLAAMAPGTLVLPGSPIAWWCGGEDPADARALADLVEVGDEAGPLQVYRQLDDAGRFVGDLVADLDALPPGMPLLVPRVLDGEPIGGPPRAEGAWREMQERGLAGRDPSTLPLRRLEPGEQP